MKTPAASPYLRPPEDAVLDQPWTDADGQRLSDRLEHWDPFTDIEISRTLEIDLDVFRSACRLGPDAAFAITASWYSNRTRLRGEARSTELGQLRGYVRAPVSLVVPGAASGGRLDLKTTVVLRYAGTHPSPISPKREGAVLWVDDASIALEGGSARFPVTAIDFSAFARFPDGAAWALEWNPEGLEGPVLGDLRLMVNSGDETLLTALRSGAADPRSATIRSFILFDVARSLVHGALENDKFVEEPEGFDQGTVGRMLFELVSGCWPTTPIKILASRRREDVARLDAELQSHLSLFG